MSFTNIAIIGVSLVLDMIALKLTIVQFGGSLGKVLVQELLASSQPEFHITALVRPSSTYTAPSPRIKVVKQDLTDHSAMVSTLYGIEAVIMTQGVDPDLEPTTKAVVEAAIQAGVKMVMPSDYGRCVFNHSFSIYLPSFQK